MSIGDLATTETHISQLFFTADRAYKLLKPVKLSFLDYSDRDQRLAAARKEVELNRRLAPDVYLGLGDLHENGELTDHLIIMRRMPDDRRLSTLVHDAGFSDCVRSVARAIATFHAALQPVSDARHLASAEAIRSLWSDNFANLRRQVPAIIGESDHARAETLAYGYLDTAMSVFAKRIDDGFVRDGHGDLIADDIFCLPDGPRILDCLAFRDDYRIGDVLADIGFLAMDLHRLAGPEAARDLMRWYQEFSYEHHPSSLAHHYVAYRAHVRAKVACLSYEAGDTDQAGLARRYHDLALHHLERARVRLILVGGPPGVGKTTVAEHLSAQFGCSHLMTDEIRKDIAGIGHDEHAFAEVDEGIYTPEMTARAYDELLREAGLLMTAGESVILDASWTSQDHRRAARTVALAHGAQLIEIKCNVDPETAHDRISARLRADGGPSDATDRIADALATMHDPWPEAYVLSTVHDLEDTLSEAADLLGACMAEPAADETTIG